MCRDDALELCLGLGVARVEIWVMTLGQLAIGGADRLVAGIARHAKGFVGVVYAARVRNVVLLQPVGPIRRSVSAARKQALVSTVVMVRLFGRFAPIKIHHFGGISTGSEITYRPETRG